MPARNFYNPLMAFLLRSPLHGLVSKNLVLLTVTGRKSGKPVTTPVNYVRDGEALLVVSWKDRTWWRNLRGGAPVTLRLRGRDVRARGEVFEEEAAAAEAIVRLVRAAPGFASYLKITLDAAGNPTDPAALRAAAAPRVIVELRDLK
jgi:deazaflavin-dependent oxidoreductase (nitroreductase family)